MARQCVGKGDLGRPLCKSGHLRSLGPARLNTIRDRDGNARRRGRSIALVSFFGDTWGDRRWSVTRLQLRRIKSAILSKKKVTSIMLKPTFAFRSLRTELRKALKGQRRALSYSRQHSLGGKGRRLFEESGRRFAWGKKDRHDPACALVTVQRRSVALEKGSLTGRGWFRKSTKRMKARFEKKTAGSGARTKMESRNTRGEDSARAETRRLKTNEKKADKSIRAAKLQNTSRPKPGSESCCQPAPSKGGSSHVLKFDRKGRQCTSGTLQ